MTVRASTYRGILGNVRVEPPEPETETIVEQLKPCPFCGGEARAEYDGVSWWFTSEHDQGCVLWPLAEFEEHAFANRHEKDWFTLDWNRRAS